MKFANYSKLEVAPCSSIPCNIQLSESSRKILEKGLEDVREGRILRGWQDPLHHIKEDIVYMSINYTWTSEHQEAMLFDSENEAREYIIVFNRHYHIEHSFVWEIELVEDERHFRGR